MVKIKTMVKATMMMIFHGKKRRGRERMNSNALDRLEAAAICLTALKPVRVGGDILE